ncbi:RNA polymerase sigma-70 factor (ECF subfamily) [Paraburkholderia unamae]|uniref:RNA polymerase sigma factor n=1 Tax=Paraburkholderia unamae TaxID=219649 RepID=UPI0015EC3181|nr:RNA polymerase sigma factor [Paraburkholderia unamae]CAG9248218.1 RNA polymerase sigma-70 factor (ECF subfamily) [Paraburkholderia unamae]
MQPSSSLAHAFAAHYRTLLAFARRRMRSAEAASDLVHDAFVKVASLQDSAEIRQPRAFFVRVIENLLIDRFRESRTSSHLHVDMLAHDDDNDACPELAVDPVDPSQFAEASQTARALEQTVNALPPRCREVFLLRKVHGLSHEAIAQRLQISKNMVEKHLRRALLDLLEFDRDAHGAGTPSDHD